MARSFFLSLDGIDGTGKSTQCRLLEGWLRAREYSVVRCAEPGGTPLGDQLRAMLLTQEHDMSPMAEALLFMASRAELLERVINPALARGEFVLSDRFLLATIVYQGYAGGLDVESLWKLGRLATGAVEPSITLVLDLPVEQAQARRGRAPDRMERRVRDFQEKVRNGFLAEAARQPDLIHVIDASGNIEEVHIRICNEVERVLAAHPRA
jgi:dTMP kinase